VQDVGDLLADPRTQHVQFHLGHVHPLIEAIAELHLLHQLLLLVAKSGVLLLICALFMIFGGKSGHLQDMDVPKRGEKGEYVM